MKVNDKAHNEADDYTVCYCHKSLWKQAPWWYVTLTITHEAIQVGFFIIAPQVRRGQRTKRLPLRCKPAPYLSPTN